MISPQSILLASRARTLSIQHYNSHNNAQRAASERASAKARNSFHIFSPASQNNKLPPLPPLPPPTDRPREGGSKGHLWMVPRMTSPAAATRRPLKDSDLVPEPKPLFAPLCAFLPSASLICVCPRLRAALSRSVHVRDGISLLNVSSKVAQPRRNALRPGS